MPGLSTFCFFDNFDNIYQAVSNKPGKIIHIDIWHVEIPKTLENLEVTRSKIDLVVMKQQTHLSLDKALA